MPFKRKEKEKPNKVLVIVTIISTCMTILSGAWGLFNSIENSKLKDSYQIQCTTTKEVVDKNGTLVKTIQNITLSYKDLQKSKDSTIQQLLVQLNQKDIAEIKERIYYKISPDTIQIKDSSFIIFSTDTVRSDSINLQKK